MYEEGLIIDFII